MPTLNQFCHNRGVKLVSRFGEARMVQNDNGWASDNWRCTLKYNGRQFTFDFFTGSLHGEPTAADCVAALLSDITCGEMSFSEFCTEFGYTIIDVCDPDDYELAQAEARKFYKVSERNAAGVDRLLGEELEEFASAALDF